MSFRRNTNRHDWWLKHQAEWAAKLTAIGLPPEVYLTEQSMRDFLTRGQHKNPNISLDEIPDKQIEALFDYATSTFDYDTADFTGLNRRRLRASNT